MLFCFFGGGGGRQGSSSSPDDLLPPMGIKAVYFSGWLAKRAQALKKSSFFDVCCIKPCRYLLSVSCLNRAGRGGGEREEERGRGEGGWWWREGSSRPFVKGFPRTCHHTWVIKLSTYQGGWRNVSAGRGLKKQFAKFEILFLLFYCGIVHTKTGPHTYIIPI